MGRDLELSSSQYLTNTTGVPVTAAPMSFSAWFKAESLAEADEVIIICQDSDNANAFKLTVEATTDVFFVVRAAGSQSAANLTGLSINTGVWNHIAGVTASSTSRFVYFNGTKSSENTVSRVPSGIDRIIVGALDAGSGAEGFWDGVLDLVYIWNVALTDNEVTALADQVHPLRIRPLAIVGAYPLSGFNSPEPDLSGSKVNLTLVNTPTLGNNAPVVPYSARFWGDGPLIEAAAGGEEFLGRQYPQGAMRGVMRGAA